MKDIIIKGRGLVDVKVSVVVMIMVVEYLFVVDCFVCDEVMFVFVVGEEVNGDGMCVFGDFLV